MCNFFLVWEAEIFCEMFFMSNFVFYKTHFIHLSYNKNNVANPAYRLKILMGFNETQRESEELSS